MSGGPDSLMMVLPPTLGGGVEQYLLTLFDALPPESVRSTLVLTHTRDRNRVLTARLPAHVELIELCKGGFVDQLRLLRELARLYSDRRPDAVLSAFTYGNVLALLARRMARHKPRMIISEHGAPLFNRGNAWLLWLARRLYSGAFALVTVSRGMRAEVARVFGIPESRVEVVFNAYHPTFDARLAATAPLDPPLPKNVPVILFVGRLAPEKGVAQLLHSAEIVLRERSVSVVVMGDGPQRENLGRLASRLGITERVTFTGYVTDPSRHLAAADVVVVPSLAEAGGTVVAEALRAGAALVATTCDYGPREMITEGRSGLLVEPDDPAGLAAAITRLLDDPALATRLRAGARAESVRFSADAMAHTYLRLIGAR